MLPPFALGIPSASEAPREAASGFGLKTDPEPKARRLEGPGTPQERPNDAERILEELRGGARTKVLEESLGSAWPVGRST